MLSEMTGARAPSTKHSTFRINRWLQSRLQTSVLALACLAVGGPAFAASAYDGNWSVVIATTGGACDPSFRYPVAITNGMVSNAGEGAATVQGRVTPRGAVRVNVQSGNQWANGLGHLGMNRGSGVWKGQGSAGACQGTWVAMRRPGAYAEQPGGPIYDYAPQGLDQGLRGSAAASCEARFRSYNPATGTYLGFDGAQHPCP
ncbi:MAG: BA14K family protein [Xanthobacteraceae bacterium]